jgi:hypothetical protein
MKINQQLFSVKMVRDSQHAINLVPDKVFPNKATYKMAYKERKS